MLAREMEQGMVPRRVCEDAWEGLRCSVPKDDEIILKWLLISISITIAENSKHDLNRSEERR